MSLRITGTLSAAAHVATGTDGSAWLQVEIVQNGGAGYLAGAPVHAGRCYGIGYAAQHAASNAAHHLRRGAQVTVHAQIFEIRLHPRPHIVLYGVDLIEQHATQEAA